MKRHFIIAGVCILILAVVAALRWPTLDPCAVTVTRSEFSSDRTVIEYRMPRPFEVALTQGVRKPSEWPEGPGIHLLTATQLRKGRTEFISSVNDFLRGEHYVYLSIELGDSLNIDGNGRRLKFPMLSAPDARHIKMRPPVRGTCFGDGIAKVILSFAASPDEEEYLMVHAGTELRRWVD